MELTLKYTIKEGDMVTANHLFELMELVKTTRKPLLMVTPWGKVALVISDKGAEYWNKKGYATAKIETLGNLILDEKGEPKENQTEIIEAFMKTITAVNGVCTEAR